MSAKKAKKKTPSKSTPPVGEQRPRRLRGLAVQLTSDQYAWTTTRKGEFGMVSAAQVVRNLIQREIEREKGGAEAARIQAT